MGLVITLIAAANAGDSARAAALTSQGHLRLVVTIWPRAAVLTPAPWTGNR